MAAASLAVRVSAQIDDLQKGFADVNKTLDGFQKDFKKTSADVQASVAGMSKGMTGFSTAATTSQKTFGVVGKSMQDLGLSFGSVGTAIGKVTGAFSSLAGAMGPTGTAIVAGLTVSITGLVIAFGLLHSAATTAFNFIKGAIDHTAALGEQLFDLSNKVGVSVESLSALKFVAAQTGTSLDAISGAVFKMSANIGKGTKDTTAAIKGLGLSLEDLSKQAPEQAFASILTSINKLPSASAQAAAGVAVFGKSFKEISQLKGENLDELIKKAKQLGLVMETETAVAADMLGDKMLELQGIFDGVQQQIGAKLIPVVLTFAELLVGIVSDAVKVFGQAFGGTGEGFKTFVVAIGTGAATIVRFFAFMADGLAEWTIQSVANFVIVGKAMIDLQTRILSVMAVADRLTNFGRNQAIFAGLIAGLGTARSALDTIGTATVKTGTAIRAVAQDIDRTAAAIAMDFGSIFEGVQAKISKAAEEMRKKLAAIGIGAKEGADAAAKALESLVDQLTGKTILAEAIKWEAALKVVGKEFHRLTDKDAKQFIGVVDEITDRFGSLEAAGVGGLRNIAIAMRALSEKGKTLDLGLPHQALGPQTLAQIIAKAQPPQMILDIVPKMSDATLATITTRIRTARERWIEDFEKVRDIVHGIGSALDDLARTSDGRFGEIVNDIANVVNALGDALDALKAFNEAQTTGERIAAVGQGIGAVAQATGQGSTASRAAGGALTGAAVGTMILPGIGTAVGAAAGFVIGLARGLGDRSGRAFVEGFADSMGGFDALHARLQTLGAEGEALWRRLTQEVGRGNEEQAQAAVAAINAAFARAEAGMKKFTDGAMKRIKAFAATVKTAAGGISDDLRKMVEMEMPELEMGIDESNARKAMAEFASTVGQSREALQAEFSRLGLYAGTAFAETLRDEGLAAALEVAGPMFDELNALSAEFGFTLEGSAAKFAAFFETAKANQDVVDALEGITLMIQGAGDAAFLTQELFNAFGTDAVAQFDKLIARGVDANTALALSQPTLQALWEAQQRFGFETDAATQALIDQGVAAGIVGADQMDVNERILQVLIAIADTFNADIPAGLRATERQSRQTAQNMSRDFEETGRRAKTALQIDVPDIEVKVNFEVGEVPEMPDFNIPQLATGGIVRKPTLAVLGEAGPELVIPLQRLREMAFLDGLRDRYGIPGLQHGGIVRSPTLALIAEAGPEAVIPLSQMGATSPGETRVILEVDGRALAEVLVPNLPGAVSRLGLGF